MVEVNREDNIYFRDSAYMFNRAVGAIEAFRAKKFRHWRTRKENSYLMQWVLDRLPLLASDFYTWQTRFYWILAGLTDFPTCPVCNKKDNYIKKNVANLDLGYPKHCCYSCASRAPEVLEKCKKTHLKNLGTEWPMQSKKVQAESVKSCQSKYGVDNVSQIDEVKQAKLATTIENFGADNKFNRNQAAQTMRSKSGEEKDEIQRQFTSTTLQHFGVMYPMQANEVQKKARSLYCYDGQQFRSSWELAKYIYHADRGDEFVYQPDVTLKYVDGHGQEHFYHPDFLVGGKLQEVKGNQFLTGENEMICPFKHSHDTEDVVERRNDVFHAKMQCMKENGVEILSKKDVEVYFQHIVEKYGSKKYLQQFRTAK